MKAKLFALAAAVSTLGAGAALFFNWESAFWLDARLRGPLR